MAKAVGQFTITDLNDVNISMTQPSSPVLNQLWLDTSKVPNQLKRWNGTVWINATPTTAGDVGAFPSGDATLLINRVSTAEQLILPTKIKQTVEEQVTANGSTVLATKSDITQTKDDWTATFSQIGGTNLILNSDKYIPLYPNLPEYPIIAQQFETGGRVRTTGPQILTAYTPIYFDAIEGQKYTTSVDVMTSAPAGLATVYGGGSTLLPAGKWVRIYGTQTATATGPMRMPGLYSETLAGWWLNYKNFKVETGSVATDWTLHPDEFYTGITRIDKDGAHFGKSGETVETGVAFNGMVIKDGTLDIASFTDAGAIIDVLQAVSITGDVLNILKSTQTFEVGSGKDYPNITQALNALNAGGKNYKFLDLGVTIRFNIYGTITDDIKLYSYMGGTIDFNFQTGAKLQGRIHGFGNTSRILVHGQSNTDRGIIKYTNWTSLLEFYNSPYVDVYWLNYDKNGNSGVQCVLLRDGTKGNVYECDFGTCQYGLMVYNAAIGHARNNKGNLTSWGYYISDGLLMAEGTIPMGPSGNNVTNGGQYLTLSTITPTASTFSPPATSPQTFTGTFANSAISTYSVEYGATSTHYGVSAAQNRWDTTTNYFKGKITFNSELYDFIADRDAGNTPTIKIRLRRKNSTHGASSGVAPTPENFTPSPAFGTATRGSWTGWVTIPYSLITSTGFTFSFYNGTTGSTYAIWDAAEIQVTKVKTI